MRSTKKASFYLFTAAIVLVPAAAVTACGDDDTTSAPPTLLDGSVVDGRTTSDGQVSPSDSGGKTDAPITPTDSGNDVNQPGLDAGHDADATAITDSGSDADADAGPKDSGPDADASNDADADAGPSTTIPNGTYKITAWTCTPAGGGAAKDVLAFAKSNPGPDISEVDLTINAVSSVDVLYNSGPCTRSTVVTVSYPGGKFQTTTSPANTCTATCTQAKCDPAAVQTIHTDTFDFTTATDEFTGTRTLPADAVNATLVAAAGCVQGDTESATYTKK